MPILNHFKDKLSLSISFHFLIARKKQVAIYTRLLTECVFSTEEILSNTRIASAAFIHITRKDIFLLLFLKSYYETKTKISVLNSAISTKKEDQIKLLKLQKLQNSWKIEHENLLLLTMTLNCE